MELLDNFKAIEVESTVDKIIIQIRGLIVSGYLKPGDKLPSERKLSEKLGIGRAHIREAIKKLEYVGILGTLPQSGVVVTGVDIAAMEGLFSNIMKIDKPDIFSLIETRVMMERFSVQQAAIRRTDEDIIAIQKALDEYNSKSELGLPSENEDFIFHLRIAEACHNSVIKTMLLIILPDIMNVYITEKVCDDERKLKRINEHEAILQEIVNKNGNKAEEHLMEHLHDVVNFSRNI
ncbi:FadR/GntR family transcriptional regulator [Saccharicrinis fermentans]|uniref:L-lactate utilization operon repressor n=1 Tax=Saccharicrinis fermentans DSM 9555 = JCM 21142 TaxID=869213 RepID=W7Y9D9_9BACT|nr:FadR/GntR family transcriptional regulator [Saccharicrinis fermentans]GAF04957.1 L-lactate utilization operon repressor [Saccharicrinis fermentans DSM 9555 = JCM 21142]